MIYLVVVGAAILITLIVLLVWIAGYLSDHVIE